MSKHELVELNGALSNPQPLLEGSLEELKEILVTRVGASVTPTVIRQRPGRVTRAVHDVLSLSGRPMLVRDVHRACEEHLGEPVRRSTVKSCLFEHSRGERPTFRRIAPGIYVHSKPT